MPGSFCRYAGRPYMQHAATLHNTLGSEHYAGYLLGIAWQTYSYHVSKVMLQNWLNSQILVMADNHSRDSYRNVPSGHILHILWFSSKPKSFWYHSPACQKIMYIFDASFSWTLRAPHMNTRMRENLLFSEHCELSGA
jgi:hypothetical protein